MDLVVGGVGEVLHDGAAARREARVDPLGDVVDVVAAARPRLAGHAVVGGDGDDEPAGAGLALDDLERARDLAIELGQLLLDLRRGRPVGVADVVGPLQVDQHEIGDVVGADRLALEDGGERVAFEALEQRRVRGTSSGWRCRGPSTCRRPRSSSARAVNGFSASDIA